MRAVLLLVALLAAALAAEASDPRRVWILHTNDLRGNLEPDVHGRGGMARIATLVERYRAEHPGQVLYVDCGDTASGTPLSNLFRGRPVIEVLNDIRPDAATPGNHEWDWGPEAMRQMLALATYPVVCANLVADEGPPPFRPWVVAEASGLKAGLLGLTLPETPAITRQGATEGYRFLAPLETARQGVAELRAQGASLILAVAHLGKEDSVPLARDLPDLDAIVSGHSYHEAEGLKVGRTPIVSSDSSGREVGLLEMDLDGEGRVLASRATRLPVDERWPADPEVAALIEGYSTQVAERLAEVVGSAPEGLARGGVASPLGNAITDAMREATGAQVAVYNDAGIRESLDEGPVTMGEVYRILPFDDTVVKLEMPGSTLRMLLEKGLHDPEGPLQFSGTTVTLDPFQAHLDPEATYTVATTEFMVGTRRYGDLQTGTRIVQRYDFLRDLFIGWLKAHPEVEPPPPGRVRGR